MNHAKMAYFEDAETLHLSLTDEVEAESVEISPDVTAEFNEDSELIGVEIQKSGVSLDL